MTFNLSSKLIDSFTDETSFPHKLLLINTQVSRLCKDFVNDSSANKIFSQSQLLKMIQSGGILANLIAAVPQVMFHTGVQAFKKLIKPYVNKAIGAIK